MNNSGNNNDRLDRLERITEKNTEAIQGLINLATTQQENINGLIESDRRLLESHQQIQSEIRSILAGIEQLHQIVMRREREE